MNEDFIRSKIEDLEYQIKRCDEKIRQKNDEINQYLKNAEECMTIAAKGGDITRPAEDFIRGAQEWREKADRIREYDIRKIEREKESYYRDIEDNMRELSECGNSNTDWTYSSAGGNKIGSAVPATNSRSSSMSKGGRASHRSSQKKFKPINRDKFKDSLKLVYAYALCATAIFIFADYLYIGNLVGLIASIVGPVLFAVFVAKRIYSGEEPKKAAKLFISWGLGIVITELCPSEFRVSSFAVVLVLCLCASLLLERMFGAE